MEVDTPLEEQVSKISESIQGFCAKIVDLEAHTMPSTPPEEREQREKTTMTTMESIKSLEEECAKLYEESTQVWTQLTEDAELQGIGQKLQAALEEAQNFKETMSTLPPTEKMVAITENRKLYLDINQIRAEQQAVHKILRRCRRKCLGNRGTCSCARHSEAGSARKCREVEDPHYCRDNRGNFAAGNTSKGKGCDCKRNIPEVHCDVEEGLKWLGMSHR
jgi:hypothetical protein